MKKVCISMIILTLFIISMHLAENSDSEETMQTSANTEEGYSIFVDVEESKLYLFENGKLVNTYRCSGGKWSTPSPIGTWQITNKAKWGEGFGGSWMGLNVPWGDFGIHGTLEPDSLGWASSHGCIRMDNNEVAELYKIIPIGTKVTIVDGPYGTFGKGFRYLKSGMYGSDVFEIQKKLKQLGMFSQNPNGKFGAETELAIQRYCRENGLYVRKTIDIDLQLHMGFKLIE